MADFLQQLSFPDNWEVWGIAGAGVMVAFLAFLAGRRLFTGSPTIRTEPRAVESRPTPDPFEVGSQSEKRASARRKGSSIEVLLEFDGQPGSASVGRVFDRSLGGLGISCEHELQRGTVLKVRPQNAPSTAPWVEVEVRSCKFEDGSWQLGCAFRKTPPYSVLLLFG